MSQPYSGWRFISARVVQLADVYDALRSSRPYKAGFSHEQSARIILEGDERIRPERDFDPQLLGLFRRHHGAFERIWRKLGD